MAKRPLPGRVKTRLTAELSEQQAAEVHASMLECVLKRLATHLSGRLVLALDGEPGALLEATGPALSVDVPTDTGFTDQGTGDLGQRILQVWQAIGAGPAAFFGVDSPDIPKQALLAIPQALSDADAGCGPVEDGGYWCLAARLPYPALLTGIDWGTASVYHQTQQAAEHAGLTLTELPPWHDVDTPSDLNQLRIRLRLTEEPALTRLAKRLDRIMQDSPT